MVTKRKETDLCVCLCAARMHCQRGLQSVRCGAKIAIAIARRRWRVKLSERVSRRRNNCADDGIGRREARPQGKARATIGEQLSMNGFTELGHAFLHSSSLPTRSFATRIQSNMALAGSPCFHTRRPPITMVSIDNRLLCLRP